MSLALPSVNFVATHLPQSSNRSVFRPRTNVDVENADVSRTDVLDTLRFLLETTPRRPAAAADGLGHTS